MGVGGGKRRGSRCCVQRCQRTGRAAAWISGCMSAPAGRPHAAEPLDTQYSSIPHQRTPGIRMWSSCMWCLTSSTWTTSPPVSWSSPSGTASWLDSTSTPSPVGGVAGGPGVGVPCARTRSVTGSTTQGLSLLQPQPHPSLHAVLIGSSGVAGRVVPLLPGVTRFNGVLCSCIGKTEKDIQEALDQARRRGTPPVVRLARMRLDRHGRSEWSAGLGSRALFPCHLFPSVLNTPNPWTPFAISKPANPPHSRLLLPTGAPYTHTLLLLPKGAPTPPHAHAHTWPLSLCSVPAEHDTEGRGHRDQEPEHRLGVQRSIGLLAEDQAGLRPRHRHRRRRRGRMVGVEAGGLGESVPVLGDWGWEQRALHGRAGNPAWRRGHGAPPMADPWAPRRCPGMARVDAGSLLASFCWPSPCRSSGPRTPLPNGRRSAR